MAYTTINKSSLYQNTVTYQGTSGTTDVTGVGFQPDWIMTKDRGRAEHLSVYDAVRGGGKRVLTSATNAENDEGSNGISAFNSDGFTCGQDGSSGQDGENYVAWNWKAGTTSGITTNGSTTITPSSYSFNQTAGISILKYSGNGTAGAKLAHGLGATPNFYITKRLDDSSFWGVYHDSLTITSNYALRLNTTGTQDASASYWNGTVADSVNLTLGDYADINGSGNDYICYAFTSKIGYSKFGEYVGNGSTNGPMIFTGFKPALVILKKYSNTGNWMIYDNKREGYNVDNDHLKVNSTDAEGTSDDLDLLSNGFKLRTSGSGENGSGSNYIYMAFGQSIVGSNNIPATAF